MTTITAVQSREILDSRGNPTVETDITLSDGSCGRASVPSGASTGKYEAVELRDGGTRYLGKGVTHAVSNVKSIIAKEIVGKTFDQKRLDATLVALDGTPNKKKLGANAILSVSLAFAKALSLSEKIPLWKYYNHEAGSPAPLVPTPMMNILNGGKHAAGSVDVQEFMIVPHGKNFADSLRYGVETYHTLAKILSDRKLSTLVGDEGGFAPALHSNTTAMELLVEAIEHAGYTPGNDISIAIDAAASSFFSGRDYSLATEKKTVSAQDLIALYQGWAKRFPLISIEDGLAEDSWEDWKTLTQTLGKNIKIVGDDLFATNKTRLERGIAEKAGNSILVKLNQIGTVTETIETVITARNAGFTSIISHRSGETEDVNIAHLSVGLGVGWIKTGAPCRTERTAKYNELLRIEESIAG